MSYLPTKKDDIAVSMWLAVIKRFIDRTLIVAGIHDYEIIPVGSTAMGTYLKDDCDIDVFILHKNPQECFNIISKVAERGYEKKGALLIWHTYLYKWGVDLVFVSPDNPITETLKHTEFYKDRLTDRIRTEIRHAKALFKSFGCYGAEQGGITGICLTEMIRKFIYLGAVCEYFLGSNPKYRFIEDPTKNGRNLLASLLPIREKQVCEACKSYLQTLNIDYKPFELPRYKWDCQMEIEKEKNIAQSFQKALKACNKAKNEIKHLEPEVKIDFNIYILDKVVICYNVNPERLPKYRTRKIRLCDFQTKPNDLRKILTTHPNGEYINRRVKAESCVGYLEEYEPPEFYVWKEKRKETNVALMFAERIAERL